MPVRPQPSNTDPVGGRPGGELEAECDQGSKVDAPTSPRAQDEEIHAQDDGEDAQCQKSLKSPDTPTKEEMADHRANGHLPHRSWCPDCVEAFGRERAHRPSEGRSIPLISYDYLFVTPRGAFGRGEVSNEEQEGALKVLVSYCSETRSIFAHAVPKKGVDERGYIIEQLKQDVLWLGHSRVVIKSDSESALVQVMDALSGALKLAGLTSVTNEGSVPYDPQTNGMAEGVVRFIKG